MIVFYLNNRKRKRRCELNSSESESDIEADFGGKFCLKFCRLFFERMCTKEAIVLEISATKCNFASLNVPDSLQMLLKTSSFHK